MNVRTLKAGPEKRSNEFLRVRLKWIIRCNKSETGTTHIRMKYYVENHLFKSSNHFFCPHSQWIYTFRIMYGSYQWVVGHTSPIVATEMNNWCGHLMFYSKLNRERNRLHFNYPDFKLYAHNLWAGMCVVCVWRTRWTGRKSSNKME